MEFLVSTIVSNVFLTDLGLYLTHPTTDRDIAVDFSAEEIAHSVSLTAAITQPGATLSVKVTTEEYGNIVVDGYFYNPYLFLQENITAEFKEKIVTTDEITARNTNVLIYPGVFPIQVSSTTSATKRVVCNNAAFQTWLLDAGDIIVITGSAAAGIYTVAAIINQITFDVVESIVSTMGTGSLSAYHPPGAKIVGFDSTGLTTTTATNVQDAIAAIDGYIINAGLTNHHLIDDIVHAIAENNYTEYTYIGTNVSNITIWTTPAKIIKIREQQFSYNGIKVSQEIEIQYNAAGTEIQRLTTNYTYSGSRIISSTSVEIGL
jgi:hypothetical protein